jgi:hypothetical protein
MRLAVVTALALLLAGCAAPGPAPPSGGASRAQLAASAPGCDAARPAIAHHANGTLAPNAAGRAPIPCAHLVKSDGRAGEPNIGVCPKDGAVVFFPATLLKTDAAHEGGGISYSLDDGATWSFSLIQSAGQALHKQTLDPYMYLDPATCRIFADDLQTPDCGILSFTDDHGATWTSTVDGCTEFDHQTIFAGKPVTSATRGYPNVVYRCAINAVALADASTSSTCLKSLDGGMTFAPTGAPAFVPRTDKGHQGLPGRCDGALGHGVADAKGTIYLPKGWCGEPWLAISRDEGLTWDRVRVSTKLGMAYGPDGAQSHEAGVGVDAAGNVYYLWTAQDWMPYLAVSRDGGKTWGEPIAVAPPGLREATLPALAVGGVGKVAIVYMGSLDSPRDITSTDCTQDVPKCAVVFASPDPLPRDANATWGAFMTIGLGLDAPSPTFWSAEVNDPARPYVKGACGPIRCQQVYDFLDVRIAPDGTPWASLIDDGGHGVAGHLAGGPSLLD